MITSDSLIEIGRFLKAHGIKGEIVFAPDYDLDLKELRCLVVEVDGIFVPFFVEKVRTKGAENLLVKIEDLDDEKEVSLLVNKSVYAMKEDVDIEENSEEEGLSAHALVGYTMVDENDEEIGVIESIDDTTENWLFMVRDATGDNLYAIPVADEFITFMNPDTRTLGVTLPAGLLELQS